MSRSTLAKEQDILSRIKVGDRLLLEELYRKHRSTFSRWVMKHHQCEEEEVTEVYQKAFTILYYNIRDGKLTELNSSLETYLFGIGKRVLYELFRARQKRGVSLQEAPEARVLDTSYLQQEAATHQQEVIASFLGHLGAVCQQILKLYYFRSFTMESIAMELGYKNDKVAKKKKYECLKKLRDLVKESGYEKGDLLES